MVLYRVSNASGAHYSLFCINKDRHTNRMHNLKNAILISTSVQKTPHKDTAIVSRFSQYLKRSGYTFGLSRTKRLFIFILIILPLTSLHATTAHKDYLTMVGGITTTTESVLTPQEAITFTFPSPQNTTSFSVTPSPSVQVHAVWNDTNTQLTITPKTAWKPATQYTIALTPTHTPEQSPSAIFTFHTQEFPQITETTPRASAQHITLDDTTTIVVHFDREISSVLLMPKIEGMDIKNIHVDTAKRTLTFQPTTPLTMPQRVHVEILAAFATAPEYITSIGSFAFDAVPPVPKTWPKEAEERLKIAAIVTQPKILSGKYIDVNLTARVTTLFNDGKIVKQFINSPGAESTPTLTGTFKIENKALRPLSQMFNVYLPYWMAFTPDGKYGFHDLVEWPPNHPDFPDSPNGGKESLRSIDKAVSPGCVRHDTPTSKELYTWTEIGTPVIIHK